MAYFGGGGVQGNLHASLRAYIDCFDSAPFPKSFPRQGGIWNQDPILMRDFRIIRGFELQWKANQEQLHNASGEMSGEGGGSGLEHALDEFIQSQENDDYDYFS